jgi:hypothetical protein
MSETTVGNDRGLWFDLQIYFQDRRNGRDCEHPLAFLQKRLGGLSADEERDLNRFLDYGHTLFGDKFLDTTEERLIPRLKLLLPEYDLWAIPLKLVADTLDAEVQLSRRDTSLPPEPTKQPVGRENKPVLPKWDRPTRLLIVDDQTVEIATREAHVQFAVLDLLEQAGWPADGVKVPNNFEGSIKDAVDELNKKLTTTRLRIALVNGGKRIVWRMS